MKKSFFLFLLVGQLFIAGCSSEEPEEEEIEETPFAFEGKWKGRWSDSLFGSTTVYAIVNSTGNNTYSGDMFISTGSNEPYTPGYGGDGSIHFETDGETKVIEFTYEQVAPNYNGGCPGLYEGSGFINESINSLVINFTGTDCDGFHDDARFIWELDE